MSIAVQNVVEILSLYTPFAKNIVGRQAERLGYTVVALPTDALPQLVRNVCIIMKTSLEPKVYAALEVRLQSALSQRQLTT